MVETFSRRDEPLGKALGLASAASVGFISTVMPPSSGPDRRRSVWSSEPCGISAVDVAISTPPSITLTSEERRSSSISTREQIRRYLAKRFFQLLVIVDALVNDVANDRVENRSAENQIVHLRHRLVRQPRHERCFDF